MKVRANYKNLYIIIVHSFLEELDYNSGTMSDNNYQRAASGRKDSATIQTQTLGRKTM